MTNLEIWVKTKAVLELLLAAAKKFDEMKKGQQPLLAYKYYLLARVQKEALSLHCGAGMVT